MDHKIKSDAERVEEFEQAIDDIRTVIRTPKQTLPQMRHAISLILQRFRDY
jgi:hypothetical protein